LWFNIIFYPVFNFIMHKGAMIPGFILSTLAGVGVSMLTRKPEPVVMDEFNSMEARMNEVHGKGIGSII